MSDAEQKQEEAPAPEQGQGEGSSAKWYEKPEGIGNTAGDKIQETLDPVGKYVGKGLETVARPLGGIVDPTVGGIMRAGEAFGNQANVGYGNKEGGPAKAAEKEGERMKEPIGGKEQNADNPLGL